jgi:magnesium transporter
MKVFPKRYHPPGTSPGTLANVVCSVPLTMRLVDYSDSDYVEQEISEPAECAPFLARDSATWVQVQGRADAPARQ